MCRLYLLLFLSLIVGCKEKSSSSQVRSSQSEYNADSELFTDGLFDGEYCAEVDYYYYKTGTNSTYILKVEIENNELTKIFWPNGGWLDDTHFTPPEIEDGEANFESDQGVEYNVRIIGEDGDCTYSYDIPSNFHSELDDEICPECGRDKYSWKELCNRCIDLEENTCSKCGSFEYGVNGGICEDCQDEICDYCGGYKSSFDLMCSSCQRSEDDY